MAQAVARTAMMYGWLMPTMLSFGFVFAVVFRFV